MELDGWWCEGYTPEGGWIIGAGEEYEDTDYQDQVESQAIFDILENEVVPLFYSCSADKLPRRWIHRMKNTVKWCVPRFNAHRMVAEYTRRFYNPAAEKWRYLTAEAMTRARALSMWKANVKDAWPELSIGNVQIKVDDGKKLGSLNAKIPQLEVGSSLNIEAEIDIGRLTPDDVSVEIYHGIVDAGGKIENGEVARMDFVRDNQDGKKIFTGSIPCRSSGQHGFALRILPRNEDMVDPYEPGMILWETDR